MSGPLPAAAGVLPSTAPVSRSREAAWLGLSALAIAILLAACRGAPWGTPVLDDYRFLETLRFHRLSWLDSMGWEWYWRPVSRQLYFLFVGPGLIAHPVRVVALHVVLLAALTVTLFRIARHAFPPALAAAIATFPVLGEPMRVLVTWASGAQYLLAMLGLALAVERTLAGRMLGAALAMAMALLSHESALLALPLLPAIAIARARSVRAGRGWIVLAVALGLAWLLGLRLAVAHGLAILPLPHGVFPVRELPALFLRGLVAQLNLEDFPRARLEAFGAGYAGILVVALGLALRGDVRARLAARGPVLVAALAWFAIYMFPLVYLEPGWVGWRSALPGLGLAILIPVLLAAVAPWLAGACVVLRLTALALAPPPPAVVTATVPASQSYLSFPRLARLQRLVDSTRLALLGRHPSLPSGAVVRYWNMPQGADWAFQRSRALAVWYGDTSLTWDRFGGSTGLDQRVDALVAYNPDRASPAVVVEPRALELFLATRGALSAGRLREADSLLAATLAAQPVPAEPLSRAVLDNQVRVALARGDLARAAALNRRAHDLEGETARYWTIEARLAIARHDPAAAEAALRRCLTLEPGNPEGEELARALGLIR